MSQCNCHCEVTNIACDTCCLKVKTFLLILCLEIDIKIIKREVVYSSFLLIIISVLFSLFSFNSLTVHKKNYQKNYHE